MYYLKLAHETYLQMNYQNLNENIKSDYKEKNQNLFENYEEIEVNLYNHIIQESLNYNKIGE